MRGKARNRNRAQLILGVALPSRFPCCFSAMFPFQLRPKNCLPTPQRRLFCDTQNFDAVVVLVRLSPGPRTKTRPRVKSAERSRAWATPPTWSTSSRPEAYHLVCLLLFIVLVSRAPARPLKSRLCVYLSALRASLRRAQRSERAASVQ